MQALTMLGKALAGLFWLAAWRDRAAHAHQPQGGVLQRHQGIVYGLSLAV